MNPNSDRDMNRLSRAVEVSRWKLQVFRENRYERIRQYVGLHYSEDGASDKVPINLIETAVSIYIRQLAANAPKALATPLNRGVEDIAGKLELALNHLIKEINFAASLREVLLDSFFGMGIMKVGLEYQDTIELHGFFHDVTQPFADPVGLDDWVHDISATHYEGVSFAGNRYSLPFDAVKESNWLDKKARDRLQPSIHQSYNEHGDTRVQTLSQGFDRTFEETFERIDLWDLWLPRENLVVTVQVEDSAYQSSFGPPLRVVEWNGPEGGPYHLLRFNLVPDNIMPLAPVALWDDLHDLANRLFRKLARQGERQKTILGVAGGADEDGERIVRANDGEAVRLDNPERVREFRFGGMDNQSLAFLIQTRDLFSWLAGNLDMLGGLGPQSQTLGQDKLLAQSASKRVSDMQDIFTIYTAGVIKDLGLYLWTDRINDIPLTKSLPGVPDVAVRMVWTPEEREGDYYEYNVEIEPYSMQHRSPSGRLQTIQTVFSQFISPMMPLLQQQGIEVDMEALLRLVAKYTDMHELEDILVFPGPQNIEGQGPAVGQPPGKPPVTTRVNERINNPGTTPATKDATMIQALLAQGGRGPQLVGAGGGR